MENKLVIVKQEKRILSAYFQEKDMVQVTVEPENNSSILGNIYLGKVKNIVKNINAAFVELSGGIMSYLPLAEQEDPVFANEKKTREIQNGDELLVQVVKENIKTKAPVVTTNLNITGKYAVLTHGNKRMSLSGKIRDESLRASLKELMVEYQGRDYGIIIRTNAVHAQADWVTDEIEALHLMYEQLIKYGVHKARFSLLFQAPAGYICDIRDGFSGNLDEILTDDRDIYEEMKEYLSRYQKEDLSKLKFYQDEQFRLSSLYGIQSKLEKALQERVWLKCGGYLVIQPTEALTVIDVNTGKAVDGKKKVQETFRKVNLEAAREIARQIRLRNLSGIIIVDFIDMTSEQDKKGLMEQLDCFLKEDPVKTVLVDITALGLAEITRKKVRKPLLEQYKGVLEV